MRRHNLLTRSEDVFVVVFISYLVVSYMLRCCVAVPPEFETALTVTDVAVLGAMAYALARLLRKAGEAIGTLCFESNKCATFGDIALIYIESGRETLQ